MSQRINTKIREASKKAVAVIALFAFALPFAGCAKKEEGAKWKINIPGLDGSLCGAPIYIAYENGYFKEEGFDVTLISYTCAVRSPQSVFWPRHLSETASVRSSASLFHIL